MKIKNAIIITLFLSITFVIAGCQSSKVIKTLSSAKDSKEKEMVLQNSISEHKNEDIAGSGISKSYDFGKAIAEGNVVMVSLVDDKASETIQEVYNIDKIDKLVSNFNNLTNYKVRLIKYVKQGDNLWINKLNDMVYDGQEISYISYDTYGQGKQEKSSFDKIVKTQSSNGIRYALINGKNSTADDGMTVISLLASSIKN